MADLPRRRGRPPLADGRMVDVHFRLPAKQYDLTQKQADEARLPLADWFRRAVAQACRPLKGGPLRRST